MSSPTTSLVIPVYSANLELLRIAHDCLSSLSTDRPSEVIVVDDGSPFPYAPGSDAIRLIALDFNHGYVAAVNKGIAAANGDIIIVGNSDLIFFKGWLGHLLDPFADGYDITTIRTTEPDGWTTEDFRESGAKFGCIFALSRRVYTSIGGLDERFLHYFADTDYRHRAIQAGFLVCKNHRGLIGHRGAATYGVVHAQPSRFLDDRRTFMAIHGFLE
jgi:GT2 family glycosyltransferase